MKTNYGKKLGLFFTVLLCIIMLSAGCGTGGGSSSISENSSDSYSDYYAADDVDTDEEITDYSGAGEGGSSNEGDGSENKGADSENSEQGIDGTPQAKTDASSGINTEMLVYTCDISIDTLDYEKSITDFKAMLKSVNGFIENESYSDGRSKDSYYIEDAEKEKRYKAAVRVPHDKYEDFLAGTDNLGDVRSQTSNVDNVSREYSDLNTSLKIYEEKEKRYIKRLASIEDEAQAVALEKELTELQIQIAQLKTRLSEIKTDVDYSTINITLREVTKYNEKPQKTDTFWQRLKNTLSDTWSNFLVFLEALLFFAIRVFPYIILLGILILIIYLIQKKVYAKRDQRMKNRLQNSSKTKNMIQFTNNDTSETPDDEEEHD